MQRAWELKPRRCIAAARVSGLAWISSVGAPCGNLSTASGLLRHMSVTEAQQVAPKHSCPTGTSKTAGTPCRASLRFRPAVTAMEHFGPPVTLCMCRNAQRVCETLQGL